MSASAKKKLRKEQNAAQLTEKQLKEQKEVKKLKAYTTVFVVAIIAVLVAALVFGGINFYKNSGVVEKNTVAATVNDEKINSVVMSYYYNDLINSTYSQWNSSYGENLSMFMNFMGLDATKPLSEQNYDEDTTWADYFLEGALEQAKSDHLLYTAAVAEGFTLSEGEKQAMDESFSQMTMFAAIYGYPDVATYLRAMYGPGATEDSYYDYFAKSTLASAYYDAHNANLNITDADIRAYEEGRYDEFSSYSFASYHLGYTDYLTGGTEGEDGTTVYTDAEKQAARDAAKADAETLAKATTVDELDKAIAALEVNKDSTAAKSTVFNNSLYSKTSGIYRDWLTEEGNQVGDCKVIPYESIATDENGTESTVVNDYYVVLFLGSTNNEVNLGNIRHILVKFEGGTANEAGVKTYTDEEKAAAKAEAEAILAEMTADGTVTEEEFIAMVSEKTDDTASSTTGGLYENITPEYGVYEEAFTNWAVDPARVAGETGIIETGHGYHIMYYVAAGEQNYRDYMIENQIRSETMEAWYMDILASGTAFLGDTSRLNKDITFSK